MNVLTLRRGHLFCAISLILISHASFAADLIELPQEELARESVLPVFDKPLSVKNRAILQSDRFEGNIFLHISHTPAASFAPPLPRRVTRDTTCRKKTLNQKIAVVHILPLPCINKIVKSRHAVQPHPALSFVRRGF